MEAILTAEAIMSRHWFYCLAIVAMLLLPVNGIGPLAAADTTDGPIQRAGEAAIRRALTKPLEVKYDKLPLQKVAKDLAGKLGVPVLLDVRPLADNGIKVDVPVTFASSRVSAKAAIGLMLCELELTTVIRDEVLLVTTPEEADNQLHVGVYEVTDLVRDPKDKSHDGWPDFDALADVIAASVKPTSWSGSGPAPLSPLMLSGVDMLIFEQTQAVHEEVERLLSNLRAVRHAQKQAEHRPTPIEPAITAVRRALESPLDLKYDKAPLRQVAEDIQRKLGLPVRLDKRALRDSKIPADTPVTFAISGTSARTAISLLLRPLGLTAVPRYEVLLITTPDEAEQMLETRVYDVAGAVGRNHDSNGRLIDQPDFDSLIDAITSNIRPTTWDGVGGPGSIMPFESAGIVALVVTQTESVHRELESLFSRVRSVAGAHAGVASKSTGPQMKLGTPRSAVETLLLRSSPLAEAAIRSALAKPIDVRYDKTPLNRVAADLQAKLGIPVQLDVKALNDVKVAVDTHVAFASSRVSAKATIALLLRQLGLGSVIWDDVLLITTPEEAENVDETRVYDVSDLVGRSDDKDFDSIIDMITSCVRPMTWEGSGPGPTTPLIVGRADMIVLGQMQDVQEEVEALLAQLRAVRHAHYGTDSKSLRMAPVDAVQAAIRTALARTVTLKYERVPLYEVAEDLQAKLGIPVRLDVTALADAEIQPHVPVTIAVSNISAKSAIDLMLRTLGLTAIAQYEVLLITSVEEADNMLDTRVYDVSDLIGAGAKKPRGASVSPAPATGTAAPQDPKKPAGAAAPQKRKAVSKHPPVFRSGTDLDPLMTAITANIESTSWSGPGVIAPFESSGIRTIAVWQTQAVHQQIEAFLSQLRAIRDKQTCHSGHASAE
jgi:hypothetical protein